MSEQSQSYEPGQHPDLPAPVSTTGIIGWSRQNLFPTVPNAILTVAAALFLLWLLPPPLFLRSHCRCRSPNCRSPNCRSPNHARLVSFA